MPYISKEEVKEKRQLIKKAFPNLKFSITCKNYSVLDVAIVEGDIDFKEEYKQINHFYIGDSSYSNEINEVLQSIKDIATKGQATEVEDGDYGTVPNFYLHLAIGKWNRPYILK